MTTDTTTGNKLSGSYRTADGCAQIDWNLKPTLKGFEFSAQGATADGSGGQCIDRIAEQYPTDETVLRMFQVWSNWHLNGMRAGTKEQRALGWGNGFDVALSVNTMTPAQKKALEARNLAKVQPVSARYVKEQTEKLTISERHRAQVWREVMGNINGANYIEGTSRPNQDTVNFLHKFKAHFENMAANLYPVEPVQSEIFKDSIGAPCPVTGHPYGHSWLFEPLPADVLAEVQSWPEGDGLSLHEWRSANFFAVHGIDCRISLSDTKPAAWTPAGHHYRVTLSRKETSGRLCFDFWGSKADAEKRKNPTPAAILGCIACDIITPDTLKDFCDEYGMDPDSIKDRQIWARSRNHARKLREFFTKEEANEVQGLRD